MNNKNLMAALAAIFFFGSATVAMASLSFSNTAIGGDSTIAIDTASTIMIGTASSTAITIGRTGGILTINSTTTFNASAIGSFLDKGGRVYNALAYGAICDGNHIASDTVAIKAAINAAKSVGGTAFIPAGNCQFDNSAGAFILSNFTGQLTGSGKASSITCSTMANDCFDFNNATNLDIEGLSISFTGTTTSRNSNTGYPVNIDNSSNITIDNVYLNNGDISGIRIGNSQKIKVNKLTVTNFMANGMFTINNNDYETTNLACANNQDACWEVSYFDSGTNNSCSRISLNGMVSKNDLTGIIVNGCSDVAISNAVIDGVGHQAVELEQEADTTSSTYPDNVNLSNIVITNAGYGTNPLNITTAKGIDIDVANATSTFQNIALSNIRMQHIAGRALQLADNNTVNLTVTGMTIEDAGNGSGSNSEAIRLGGGNRVNFSNVEVKDAAKQSLYLHLVNYFFASDFTSINPNKANLGTDAITNDNNFDWVSMNGINIYDNYGGTNRSKITSSVASGIQCFTNVTNQSSASWPGISVTNTNACPSSSNANVATLNNCRLGGASGTASPAACTSAAAGVIAIPASSTSYTINTTAVSTNSEIFVQQVTDNSGLPSGPTCGSSATSPIQSARVTGTSFTFALTPASSVTCVKWWIVN